MDENLEALVKDLVQGKKTAFLAENRCAHYIHSWPTATGYINVGYIKMPGIEELWIDHNTKHHEAFRYFRADGNFFFYETSNINYFVPNFLLEPDSVFEDNVMDFFKRGKEVGRYIFGTLPDKQGLFGDVSRPLKAKQEENRERPWLLYWKGSYLLPGTMNSDKDLKALAHHFLDLFELSGEQ